MAVTFREARRSDGEAMLALLPRLAAFDVPPSRNPEHLWTHDAELLKRWLAGEAEGCRVHVAEDDDGNVIGLTMVSLRPELLSREPSAHLEAIAIAPGNEGRGIGAALLSLAERDARALGAQTMSLHVFAVNERARRLYEKAGYEGELLRYIKPLEESGESQ